MDQLFRARFDNFEINSDLGLFHASGLKILLRPKELATLVLLVRRYGKLVTKEKLIAEVWKTHNVSDESIARCISIIKLRLRETSPGAEQLIKTEYGKGYRFTGTVALVSGTLQQEGIKQKRIRDIASKAILYCEPQASVLEVAKILHAERKSSVIVSQNQQILGIWTEADALTLDLSNPAIFDCKIIEVMQSPVITIQEWKPLSDAVILMRTRGIRHLLVVDSNGNASGVVSQTDLVQSHGVESFLTIKDVKSVVYRFPLVLNENLPIYELVKIMRANNAEIAIIHLPERPMFTFSERDLMSLIAQQNVDCLIAELDNCPLVTVNEQMSLLAARQLMEIEKIRHLAVVDADGNLVKVLGLSDILRVIEYSYVQLLEEILEENKHIISAKEDHIHMLTKAVQQTAGMILICDKFGKLEYVNKSFEMITGYNLDEVKGLNPRFLKSGEILGQVYQALWQTLLAGQTWKGELRNRTKAGEIYWVLASITPIFDDNGELKHYVAVEEDITARIEMETKLKEIEQRFLELSNSTPIMLWEAGSDGKTNYLNHAWTEFTGRATNELMGNGWAKFIHSDDLNDFLNTFQKAVIERCSFSIDIRLKHISGEFRWIMNTAKALSNERGYFLGFKGSCIDITERKLREEAAHALACYDNLTGLATRTLFNNRLEQSILQAERNNVSFSIINIDLDKFKSVNDVYGHSIGDELLLQVAERIRNCVRKSDTVCRYGGDEFLILVVGVVKIEGVSILAKKILKAIEQPFYLMDKKISISCSMGIASFPNDAKTKEQLLDAADKAMYQAKQNGKAQVVVYQAMLA